MRLNLEAVVIPSLSVLVALSAATALLVAPAQAAPIPWPAGLPVYDHVVIVIEENKNYEEIIGSGSAPYINGTLAAEGANLTRIFGEEHNSEGNYFWLLSGSNQGVGFVDGIPDSRRNPHYPFTAPNLPQELIAAGRSFKGYSEDLPAIGDTTSRHDLYARKHVPWISFANIPHGARVEDSSHLRWTDFPSDYSRLPTVAVVVPNLINDMHDGPVAQSVPRGDAWLQKYLDGYYQWARTHNSLLILTFDENENPLHIHQLTDPASVEECRQNRIPTLLAGAHVRHGEFSEGKGVTHVNLLRTLESMYGLEPCGGQQENALRAGIGAGTLITDVFETVR